MRAAIAALVLLVLAGCSSSGFKVANDANTQRVKDHQEVMLDQAENDLKAINACYLRAAGYADLDGTLTKIGEPMPGDSCTVMTGMLRQLSTLLMAFQPHLVQPVMARVPAAPEEIAQAILKDGMKFSIVRYGLGAVERVVSSGQLAQSQLAQQAIDAATKPAPSPILITVPEGGSASILTPD
jgi:hypothetical protein